MLEKCISMGAALGEMKRQILCCNDTLLSPVCRQPFCWRLSTQSPCDEEAEDTGRSHVISGNDQTRPDAPGRGLTYRKAAYEQYIRALDAGCDG